MKKIIDSRRPIIMIIPIVLFIIIGFNLPIISMLAKSFIYNDKLSLFNYYQIIESSIYIKVLINTFKISLITTFACVLLGYPLAYWINGLEKNKKIICISLIIIPFWISILVRTYSWIVIMGNSGIINKTLLQLGLINKPFQFLYNEFGVVLGTINVLLPFLVLPLFASMQKIDKKILQAAETLGANNYTIFWKIFFPLTIPSLAAGSILVFILTLGFFITPAILGGGRVPMISNMLDLFINQMPNWEIASSISVILLTVTIFLFIIYLKIINKEKSHNEK